jgi:thiamine-phosphate pyrophosphorylase
MIRCLVTDRRRLAGPTSSFELQRDALREQFLRAIDDRVDLIQIREPDLPAADLAAIVAAAVRASRASSTRVLVNDRLDVALACGADGVHLRGDSLAAGCARRITPPGFVISRAVHTPEEAAAAGEVDYLIAGTVFSTVSKPGASEPLGVDGLEAIVRAARAPVLAIGGVTVARFDEILRTGAAGVAGIGLFLSTALQFDSPRTSP